MKREKYSGVVPVDELLDITREFGLELTEKDYGLMERIVKDKRLVDHYQEVNDELWGKIVHTCGIFYSKYVQNPFPEKMSIKKLAKYYRNEIVCEIEYNYDISMYYQKLKDND